MKVFTEPEAARELRISLSTLKRARYRGEIEFFRPGGGKLVRYTDEQLERNRQRVTSVPRS